MGRELDLTLQGDDVLSIARDENGVPHVRAVFDTDLLRGMGYCHAVDRGIALRVTKAIAWGRATEWLSDTDELFGIDCAMRRLGLYVDAEEEVAKMPAAQRALLDAYVDGVNRGMEATGVPWELRSVGFVETPYTGADCVLLTRLMAWAGLAQSQGEMERLLIEMVQAGVPRGHLDGLFGGHLEDLDPWLLRRVTLGERVVPMGTRWVSAIPTAVASNNWVIAGDRTASGKPILANDPHLDVARLPAVWYEIVLEGPDNRAMGATMPGLPAILVGRNDTMAWGVTYAFMDSVDSWIEECKEGAYRRFDNGRERWLSFRVRDEVISRRKKGKQRLAVYSNDHGVLDGDPQVPGFYLTTRWASAEKTGAISLTVMLSLLRVSDTASALRLLGHIETAWSFVAADQDGHIGFQMSGKMPKRPSGRNGMVPLPGWDPNNDWSGFIGSDRLPWLLDPPEGYFVTANQDLNAYGKSRPINLAMGAWRADRIANLLGERRDWTIESVRKLQLDLHSDHAMTYLERLRPLLPPKGSGADALRSWDGAYDPALTAPTYFERFWRALLVEVFSSWLGPAVLAHLLDETAIVADFYDGFDRCLLDPQSPWYGDRKIDEVWRDVADKTLGKGGAGKAAAWGKHNRIVQRHLLFGGKLPAFLGFDVGPIELPGGRASINQGQVFRSGGRDTCFAPSYRFVADLADADAWSSLPGGPSDRRLSKWYLSELPRWRAGALKRLKPGAHTGAEDVPAAPASKKP
jgi:penicillin G amidase